MKRKLGVINGKNIKFVREISENEYINYMNEQAKLIKFAESQQLITMVKLNYEEFQSQMDIYLIRFIQNSVIDWIEIEQMHLNINRLILNYLSIIRTFLDHTEAKLNKQYGNNSRQLKLFKDTCSNLYDNNFSYRFLYKLRNYAQHCGMPSGEISLKSKIENSEPKGSSSNKLSVFFKRDELLVNYDSWGNLLKSELEKSEENFEVNFHISEMMICVEKINLVIIEDEIYGLLESVIKIEELLNELRVRDGTPCIVEVDDILSDSRKLNFKVQWFPLHLIQTVKIACMEAGILNQERSI